MEPTTNFNSEHYFELLRIAFRNENYEEAYKYSTMIIENAPDFQPSRTWAYKGLSAGGLSVPSKPRFQEMVSYINKAMEKNSDDSLRVAWVATNSSYIIGSFTHLLLDLFAKNQDIYAASNQRRSVVLPQKSISESIGVGLGAGIANGMDEVSNRKEAAKKNGALFLSKFQTVILDSLKFSWSFDNSDELVAQNIFWTLNGIINTTGLDKKSKESCIEEARPLIDDVQKKYPKWTINKIPGDGCCYIATSVMGDYNHPYVILLKQYRDQVLKKKWTGRKFILVYYKISPKLVRVIEKNDRLRLFLFNLLIIPSVKHAEKTLNKLNGFQVKIA